MECGLCDLGHRGVPFTCTNRRFKKGLIKGRLDRFLCSEQWRNIFSNILVAHMAARGSDYLPIWIEFYRGRSLETVRIGGTVDFILRIIGPRMMIAKD